MFADISGSSPISQFGIKPSTKTGAVSNYLPLAISLLACMILTLATIIALLKCVSYHRSHPPGFRQTTFPNGMNKPAARLCLVCLLHRILHRTGGPKELDTSISIRADQVKFGDQNYFTGSKLYTPSEISEMHGYRGFSNSLENMLTSVSTLCNYLDYVLSSTVSPIGVFHCVIFAHNAYINNCGRT